MISSKNSQPGGEFVFWEFNDYFLFPVTVNLFLSSEMKLYPTHMVSFQLAFTASIVEIRSIRVGKALGNKMSRKENGKRKSQLLKPKLYTICQASCYLWEVSWLAHSVCGITEYDQQRAAPPCLRPKLCPRSSDFPRKCTFQRSLPKQRSSHHQP